jgi:hypothetical protein
LNFLCQDLGKDRGQERAGVNTHVKNGEAGIAAGIVECIQLADHGRDVRFEHAVTDDDGGQAKLEDILVRDRNHEQAGCHEDRADQDRTLVTDNAVGYIAAEYGAGIHQREVGAVGEIGFLFADGTAAVELGDDIQDERPTNAVESKSLPEFGHEKHPQGTRVPHDLLKLGNDNFLVSSGTAHPVSPDLWLWMDGSYERLNFWSEISNRAAF